MEFIDDWKQKAIPMDLIRYAYEKTVEKTDRLFLLPDARRFRRFVVKIDLGTSFIASFHPVVQNALQIGK